MPIRMVRDWTDSEAVNSISRQAECLFVRLIMKADDFGRFHASPKLLRGVLFPLLVDSVREADLARWIAECEKSGLVRLYEIQGKPLLEIVNFGQRMKHGCRAKFPPPNDEIPEKAGTSRTFPELPGKGGNFPPELELELEDEIEDETEHKPALPDVAVAWNEIEGVVHVRSMTKARSTALRARMSDPAWAGSWRDAIAKVRGSSFCKGTGNTGWRADFDWFLRPDTLTKVLEGKYDSHDAPRKSKVPTQEDLDNWNPHAPLE